MKLVTPPKSKREIKIELTGSKNIGKIICPGCNGKPISDFGICAGCDGSGVREIERDYNSLAFKDYLIAGFAIAFLFSVIVLGLTT